MRIAYIGNFEPEFSTENDVRLAFEELGHEVIQLQENKRNLGRVMAAQGPKPWEVDLVLWTSTWDDAIGLENGFSFLRHARQQGIPTATYHLDTFHGISRNGRRWWLNPMFYTDYVFTADGNFHNWHQDHIHHIWLPAGVRHTVAQQGKGTPQAQYEADVAFVGADGRGNYHPEWPHRRWLVDSLEAICRRRGWRFRNPGGREPKVERQHMADFYASVAVTVGDSLCLEYANSRYWSDRPYEAMGRGGCLIMPTINVLQEMFGHDLPTFEWYDVESLEAAVQEQLETPTARALRVTRNLDRVREQHTYVSRMEALLQMAGLT